MTTWHVRAIRLPEGGTLEDSWLTRDGWSEEPVADAEDLPGRFALPGFVDAHSHVSFGDGGDGPLPLDRAGAEANLERSARAGVAVIRDAGGDPSVVLRLPHVAGRPHVVAAGRHLAPAGYYFEAVHHPVEATDLVEVALRELAAGARWVKLVADFPSVAARASSVSPVPELTFDLDVVRELVAAAHGAGARVAAHVTTELVRDLVALGIDSVEHGTALDEGTVTEMARRGTAWTPTLCAALSVANDAPEERQRVVAERRERFQDLLPAAVRRGVSVLTGSDVVGSVPREIALLVECGLEPVDALRASTITAMRFLGDDVADAPSSIVTFAEDPRDDPAVLTRPAAIVIAGVRLR
jgi:imidazolonepropionase-like amidohydrolase